MSEWDPQIEYLKGEFDQPMPIETIKAIFAKAKTAKRDKDGDFEDLNFAGDLLCSLSAVGRQQLYELKNDVHAYLKDPDPDYRSQAVETLGWNTDLGLKDFQQKEAWDIWLNDPDDEVRVNALTAWANYYYCKKDLVTNVYYYNKDPVALQRLYDIFSSENYSYRARAVALHEFLIIADAGKYYSGALSVGMSILNLEDLKDHKAITKAIDWEKVHSIMQELVPNWHNIGAV